jgi:Flp pilus assembly protein TadD
MASLRQDFHDAIATFRQGDYPQAQEILTRLALENTENAQIRLWLGAACREAGCFEDAITNFQEVLRLSQDSRVVKIARTSLAKLEELMAQQDKQLLDPPQEQAKSLQVADPPSASSRCRNNLILSYRNPRGSYSVMRSLAQLHWLEQHRWL